MAIRSSIRNVMQRFVPNNLYRPQPAPEAKVKEDKISLQVVPRPNPRSREDISTWLDAVKQAEHPDYPRRLRLYNLYETIELDNHLSALVDKRISRIKGHKFILCNEKGDKDHELMRLLDTPWFYDFLGYVMESVFWGHSLIQFNELKEGRFQSVELVPRKHVKPETGDWLVYEFDMDGRPYRDTALMDWYIEVGAPKALGLYKKAGPLALWKKNTFAQWSQFTELFGIPFRSIKTPGRDQRRMNMLGDIAANMGSAGWAILQDDETIDIVQTTGSDAYAVFDQLIERCNTEMSKLVMHQTMTNDNGSSRSQAEVHESVAEDVHMADKAFIKMIVNTRLLPLLINHGYPLKNVRFDWDNTYALPVEERIKIDQVLLAHYQLDAEYIKKTYQVEI